MNSVEPNIVEERYANSAMLYLAMVFWLLLTLVSKLAYSPPVPVKATAPNDVFSAERAEVYLTDLVGDGIPHPAGSEHNIVVGDRVKKHLESFGYEVEEQLSNKELKFRRSEDDSAVIPLRNLIAIKSGDPKLGSVMIACHYDSVPYGPGASDDGVAVAALLEIARMAVTELSTGREIIFLFTDGEEFGLLGADAFVTENSLAQRVEFVVNLEARGTSGPSLMFQTSQDSKQLVEIFTKSVRRPVTSSIFEEVYKRLPNDTDFTIFRDNAGMRGFNFAFIGNARNYHTPEDNLANVDRRSLQHHGENAWGLLKSLTTLDSLAANTDKVVYFDFYGTTVIRLDSNFAIYASWILLAVWTVWTFHSQKKWTRNSLPKSILSLLVSSLAIGIVCWLIHFSYNIQNRLSPPWVDYPEPITLSFWAMATSVGLFCFNRLRTNADSVTFVVWFSWALVATLITKFVIGASYLFLLPVAFSLVAQAILARHSIGLASLLGTTVVAVLWVPVGTLFYDAIGFSMVAETTIRIVFLNLSLLPLAAASSPKTVNQVSSVLFFVGVVSVVAGIWLNPAG